MPFFVIQSPLLIGRATTMDLFRGMNAQQLEYQYELRSKEADFDAVVARWLKRSAALRDSRDVAIDLAYGSGDRDRLDLFRAAAGGPLLVYIHGGYWQRGDKDMYSFVAESFLDAGINVAMINYTLTPACRVGDIAPQVRRCMAWLWHNSVDLGFDRERLSVMGHSAGGHLTAMMMATDWPAFDPALPDDFIRSALPISGIFELEPLVHTSINAGPRMDVAEARRESPLFMEICGNASHLVIAGGAETPEFARQSDAYCDRFRTERRTMERYDVPGENHFGELERLAESTSEVFSRSLKLVDR